MDLTAKPSFFSEKIAPDMWRFNEGMGETPYVDAYLVVGSKRAAFIDALQSEQPRSLAAQIREITDLPVDVLITHGHPDHAGAEVKRLCEAEGFTLYMSHEDLPIAQRMFAPWFTAEMFGDIREGDTFDLGGVVLEAYRVAGHTPGSMAFLDRAGRRCFTGDIFGVWLQLDHSLPMETYAEELRRFAGVMSEVPGAQLWTGHLTQADPQFTAAHVTAMRIAAEKILSGELVGREIKLPPQMADSPMAAVMKGAYSVREGQAAFTYRPDRLKK